MHNLKTPHSYHIDEAAKLLEANLKKGLSSKEVKNRLSVFGYNVLISSSKVSFWKILANQLFNPLVYILLIAAALGFVFSEWIEGLAILAVIVVNAAIGFYMEYQAVESMESLKSMSRHVCKVIRNGKQEQVEARTLVPGDLIQFESGDLIPADAIVSEENNLGLNESVLTGESHQIHKEVGALPEDTELFNRKNLVFKGTSVSRGNGKAIIYGTGLNTELGRISKLTEEAKDELSPLEKRLKNLSKKLIGLTVALAGLIVVIGILRGHDLFFMIETAIALAVAAIPEGLPIVATIALARGMLRLARKKVIVKNLNAVEALGETQVIFTDKTGTLTENKLHADHLMFYEDSVPVSFREDQLIFNDAPDKDLSGSEVFYHLILVSALCNNAELKSETSASIGDPLEIALLQLVQGSGNSLNDIRENFPRVNEVPFDSDSKRMLTINKNLRKEFKDEPFIFCVKGAFETVVPQCSSVLTKDGQIEFDNKLKQKWEERASSFASNGLRVLSFAYKYSDIQDTELENDLTLLGLIGFIDPARTDIKSAIDSTREAGIRVNMITGDNIDTAYNIAEKVGIARKKEEAVNLVSGFETDSDTLLDKTVFARVSPEQKLEIVKLFQSHGFTVGMTGDGVNDAPALKKADIGIAMGMRGTDTAKEASDLILKDDSFKSIVLAVRLGRGIFENIRHFVVYLLSCNLSELLVVSVAFIANLPSPLLPLQILFINMVTDVFPALALGMNKEPEDVMKKKPRDKNEAIITRKHWASIWVYAFSITIATLLSLWWAMENYGASEKIANNTAFYTLILAQLWNLFNLSSAKESFFKNEITKNYYAWGSIVLCIVIVVVVYLIPVTKEVLQLEKIDPEIIGVSLAFSFLPVLIVQILKRSKIIL